MDKAFKTVAQQVVALAGRNDEVMTEDLDQ